ncbi:MAG: SDR family oxidoreductase [Rhodothermales bacterium]|nr:SDR family oxidoreductase [Rhodothermales bacterium]MBO6779555.1 SDR family oxidoreductase [Rhodothermales bacterium]
MHRLDHTPHSVVLGGAGFVGSHLCDLLLSEGHQVTCVDSLVTGRAANVEHLLGRSDFEFVATDIRNDIPVDGPVDFVYNMASPASPKHYFELPILTLETGSIGTQKALDFAHAHGARFLMASTSEVYGEPEIHPQVETYWGNVNPIGVRSVYDEAKRYSEALVMAYRRELDADTVIVRIFNTYGPRMRPDDGRALPAFISQALSGDPITIHGDGSQTRSFCYVEDLVRGLYLAATSGECGPINLGNPSEVSIKGFAAEVVELCGSTSQMTFHPRPQDDPTVRRPDITQARKKLGWEPRVERADGLARTIAYFREELSHPDPTRRVMPAAAADRGPVRAAERRAETRTSRRNRRDAARR